MFLDDLLNGSRKQLAAPFADIVAVRPGLGIPARRGQSAGPLVARRRRPHRPVRPRPARGRRRLPDAELFHLPGESHLGGLGRAEEILRTMMELWDRDALRP